MTKERALTQLRLADVNFMGRRGYLEASWERADGTRGKAALSFRPSKAERWHVRDIWMREPTAEKLRDVRSHGSRLRSTPTRPCTSGSTRPIRMRSCPSTQPGRQAPQARAARGPPSRRRLLPAGSGRLPGSRRQRFAAVEDARRRERHARGNRKPLDRCGSWPRVPSAGYARQGERLMASPGSSSGRRRAARSDSSSSSAPGVGSQTGATVARSGPRRKRSRDPRRRDRGRARRAPPPRCAHHHRAAVLTSDRGRGRRRLADAPRRSRRLDPRRSTASRSNTLRPADRQRAASTSSRRRLRRRRRDAAPRRGRPLDDPQDAGRRRG